MINEVIVSEEDDGSTLNLIQVVTLKREGSWELRERGEKYEVKMNRLGVWSIWVDRRTKCRGGFVDFFDGPFFLYVGVDRS